MVLQMEFWRVVDFTLHHPGAEGKTLPSASILFHYDVPGDQLATRDRQGTLDVCVRMVGGISSVPAAGQV
jgi:hypothetical protein